MKKFLFKTVIIILLGVITPIAMATTPTKTNKELNFNVEFDYSFENTIYPSLILGLSNYSAKINQSFGLISYTFDPQESDCKLKVVLEQSTVNKRTFFQESLIASNDTTFSPMINWDYESLKNMNSPGNVDLTFACFYNNTEIDHKNLRLNYRSVNECIYGIINEDGTYTDLKWMFGAYVNEDHPKIDNILQDALKTGLINSFIGYQGNSEESILQQVFALWYLLQSKGVKYSSITGTV
ncbi:hypothetical protein [Marinifilum caeruleilacunae]|uniref:Uncharacterized protein n=1 Tax=Marinifilum caeruleilacunae TaxID=2499076 RepID=A0ABX1X036_9BACT|nr:hypothetical protein [Marinifilum caeruleilacunae]NOU61751.1 hypothetical protein [Marinifilum caeruleilacunae]